ncbi:MAG: dTDP-4-dehydrorhamnose reductase [Proteobacteria bacterium]|nr:dTDP-4-dehydrorhamnose reductase [Pseudomonadota bacterium]
MKIMILGSGGTLGKDFINILKQKRENFYAYTKEQLNILNLERLNKAIDEVKPDTIINCAGYTKVDMAEIEKDKAFSVNALAVFNLAKICREKGIFLTYISTDYVFSGEKTSPYHPFDTASPLNYYGLSKLYGENYIRDSGCDYLIVRTSWLYGTEGNNFFLKLLEKSESKDEITVETDQISSPTSTITLSKTIIALLNKGGRGIYNITDRTKNGISLYTFAKKIMEVFERKTVIKGVKSSELLRPAKRPSYSVLDIEATEFIIGERLPYWEVSLGEMKRRM